MSLSGEICSACGPCRHGSRTEAQSERTGYAIEPYRGYGRHGSRTEGQPERAGHPTGPYRDPGSASNGNVRRDGAEVSRGHSNRTSVDGLRGEGPNMRRQGGAVDCSDASSNPSGGDASRRDTLLPALHDDLMERVLASENMRPGMEAGESQQGHPRCRWDAHRGLP